MLIVFNKDAQAEGKELTIKNVNNVVKEIFSVTGFDKILKVQYACLKDLPQAVLFPELRLCLHRMCQVF